MQGLVWHTATIADEGTTSGEIDLGKPFRSLLIVAPTIDSSTITLKTAMVAGGTYQALSVISTNDQDDDAITASASTGAINITVPCFGWQHLEIVCGSSQTTAATTWYVAGFD